MLIVVPVAQDNGELCVVGVPFRGGVKDERSAQAVNVLALGEAGQLGTRTSSKGAEPLTFACECHQ